MLSFIRQRLGQDSGSLTVSGWLGNFMFWQQKQTMQVNFIPKKYLIVCFYLAKIYELRPGIYKGNHTLAPFTLLEITFNESKRKVFFVQKLSVNPPKEAAHRPQSLAHSLPMSSLFIYVSSFSVKQRWHSIRGRSWSGNCNARLVLYLHKIDY